MATVNHLSERFGFLRYGKRIEVGPISLVPVENFSEVVTAINSGENRDGFTYPPPSHRVEVAPETGKANRSIPGTGRPSFLWRLPASHTLETKTHLLPDAFRRRDGLFVIHATSYFFGTRLQFADWWFDSRVPTSPRANILSPEHIAAPFLTKAYDTWRSWTEQDQIAMAGLLFMHSRVPGYEWPWERFAFEYMVLDGLHRVAERSRRVGSARSHAERIRHLCLEFAIPTDSDMVQKIVDLRNGLFHEVSFGDGPPGFSGHGEANIVSLRLRDLNRRLICALLGWDVPFVHSEWWALDSTPFDV